MDFYKIQTRLIEKGPNKGKTEVYPDFRVLRSKDLMIRGRSFYAIWDEEVGLWSTDEYDVQRLVDEDLDRFVEPIKARGEEVIIRYMRSFDSNMWKKFRNYILNVSDTYKLLDQNILFAGEDVKKSDYASKRMSYSLTEGDYSAWDTLVGTLYNRVEREKIEWAIGSIVSGDSKKIQKFLVLYGPAGTGKSTIMNIIELLFKGYTTTFEAKALGMSSGQFATEVFKTNPLVAIQHDGDLSRIEDNTRLNSIISHEEMTMNEKFKAAYTAKISAFLFMGTNLPVKISDAKSGIIRRLIDVHPTGLHIPFNQYNTLMQQIEFQLGAIAQHCLDVYLALGKNYYSGYRPVEMMFQTDVFFNYVEAYFDVFKSQNKVTLKQAYSLYKEFCSDTGIEKPIPQYKVREELRNYFDEFRDRDEINGETFRSVYSGFNASRFKEPVEEPDVYSLVLDETSSLLDSVLADQPAQLANEDGIPSQVWRNVKTKLVDISTSEIHYVKVPEDHIVIDFDIKDEDGNKSLERNLAAASIFPPTYAELSQGGNGVHLHYNWTGTAEERAQLDPLYGDGVEVKVFRGNSSLRRRLSRCNHIEVAPLGPGYLPVRKKEKVLSEKTIQSERGLRALIVRNLRKEIHPGTKTSVDFIKKILDDAYFSGLSYDVTDMRSHIIAFAQNSSNQSMTCLRTVRKMKFRSDDTVKTNEPIHPDDPTLAEIEQNQAEPITIYDCEVYPNLFVVCWKYRGPGKSVVRMINPTAQDIERLFKQKLVGFYNRKYDNHILYGRFMGMDNAQLYKLSMSLIANEKNATFGEAYNVSYFDIYDVANTKMGLKKWQITLGIPHKEMDIPWDQNVPEDRINDVVEYCENDVLATEAVLDHLDQDFVARQVLADLSGLPLNNTTNKHTAQIIFGNARDQQSEFVYTDLSTLFPGYKFESGKSSYRGEDPSEGGYVHAVPGIYENVPVLDVASMHPTSMICLNLFGDTYTPRFKELLEARLAIKRLDYDEAKKMLGGKLAPHLKNVADAEALAFALKIVINSVYGLTSAKFNNPFRDIRNVDNIVAKRGALFMIDLKHYAEEELGLTAAHIKTDSIKLPGATEDDIQKVIEFGKKYGYTFEHEATYRKFCLVNDAVYIASKIGKDGGIKWDAVGAQFQHPYVYKALFSKESIKFDDLCETKQVTKGALYLDFDPEAEEPKIDEMKFVGLTGRFTPVLPGYGGAALYRMVDGKIYAASGTKGYLWMESDLAKNLPPEAIDMSYFEELESDAIKQINKFGDFEEFTR